MALASLLAGVAVVLGGILIFRLHAFLALVGGALVVGLLTPSPSILRHEVRRSAFEVVAFDSAAGMLLLKGRPPPGTRLDVIRLAPLEETPLAVGKALVEEARPSHLELAPPPPSPPSPFKENARPPIDAAPRVKKERSLSRACLLVSGLIAEPGPATSPPMEPGSGDARGASSAPSAAPSPALLLPRPGDLAVATHELDRALKASRQSVGDRLAAAFGSTCASLGLLVAMAAVIGACLLESGAADRIVRAAIGLFGPKGTPVAFISSGFLLGIPVFFDTVFYLMIPLARAARLRTGHSYLLYVLTIIAGATMAHSLVPPTPGPLFAAEALGVDLGLMILVGGLVGIITATYGFAHAVVLSRHVDLPLRGVGDTPVAELERIRDADLGTLPPLWLSLLPIALPVGLIGAGSFLGTLAPAGGGGGAWLDALELLGNKTTALILAAAVALLILALRRLREARSGGSTHARSVSASLQGALSSGGTIILITCAGGAFGAMIQQTGVADLVGSLEGGAPAFVLTIAFLITAMIRSAQGSATVAMITAVGVLSGLADVETLGFHPVYLAVAIGCG